MIVMKDIFLKKMKLMFVLSDLSLTTIIHQHHNKIGVCKFDTITSSKWLVLVNYR